MHPNPIFRKAGEDWARGYAAARGFGMLAVNADEGPLLSHIPFLLEGDTAEFHLMRSNPIARLGDGAAVLAVGGPDGYISPDWYGVADQVPTWNYIAVHLRGRLERRPREEIRGVVDRLSARFEAELHPKPPWTSGKMNPDVLERMLGFIVPFHLHVEGVLSTVKLNQNKDDRARLAAADGVEQSPRRTPGLAALMRDPPA